MALPVSSGPNLLELKKQQVESALLWTLPGKGREPEPKTNTVAGSRVDVFFSDPPGRWLVALPFDQVIQKAIWPPQVRRWEERVRHNQKRPTFRHWRNSQQEGRLSACLRRRLRGSESDGALGSISMSEEKVCQ